MSDGPTLIVRNIETGTYGFPYDIFGLRGTKVGMEQCDECCYDRTKTRHGMDLIRPPTHDNISVNANLARIPINLLGGNLD